MLPLLLALTRLRSGAVFRISPCFERRLPPLPAFLPTPGLLLRDPLPPPLLLFATTLSHVGTRSCEDDEGSGCGLGSGDLRRLLNLRCLRG